MYFSAAYELEENGEDEDASLCYGMGIKFYEGVLSGLIEERDSGSVKKGIPSPAKKGQSIDDRVRETANKLAMLHRRKLLVDNSPVPPPYDNAHERKEEGNHFGAGLSFEQVGDNESALICYMQAIVDYFVKDDGARTRDDEAVYVEALMGVQRVTRDNPDHDDTHGAAMAVLSYCFEGEDRIKAANFAMGARDYQRAAELYDGKGANLRAARAWRKAGDEVRAREMYDKALLSSESRNNTFQAGRIASEMGDPKRALELYVSDCSDRGDSAAKNLAKRLGMNDRLEELMVSACEGANSTGNVVQISDYKCDYSTPNDAEDYREVA